MSYKINNYKSHICKYSPEKWLIKKKNQMSMMSLFVEGAWRTSSSFLKTVIKHSSSNCSQLCQSVQWRLWSNSSSNCFQLCQSVQWRLWSNSSSNCFQLCQSVQWRLWSNTVLQTVSNCASQYSEDCDQTQFFKLFPTVPVSTVKTVIKQFFKLFPTVPVSTVKTVIKQFFKLFPTVPVSTVKTVIKHSSSNCSQLCQSVQWSPCTTVWYRTLH